MILLYNIGSRQNMENRVKNLQEKIREIHMDGMEGHTFTLSAGIAFAPQDGGYFYGTVSEGRSCSLSGKTFRKERIPDL